MARYQSFLEVNKEVKGSLNECFLTLMVQKLYRITTWGHKTSHANAHESYERLVDCMCLGLSQFIGSTRRGGEHTTRRPYWPPRLSVIPWRVSVAVRRGRGG